MRKAERAAYIQRRLQELYPHTPVPLDHHDPFTLLVAVLLSAQCTDERVNQVTPALFALADTPAAMAALDADQIREIIRSCGLSPQKSLAIKRLSQILVEEHGGKVPADWAALERLPGVGHKTASVVMAQAFGVPAFPVEQTERDLKRLFPREHWNRLHLQIIFYGRQFCTARGCDGRSCEICRNCYPRRKQPKVTRKA